MSLNATPSANRLHIGFFGCRNAGKSSIVNAVTGQDLAVVSDVAGTTTDPVQKAMELLPLGPVVIIDTPGFDDEGTLGEKRVLRTKRTLNRTDIAVLVVDATTGMRDVDLQLVQLFEEKHLPYVVVLNKTDLLSEAARKATLAQTDEHAVFVSALTGTGIHELKERLGSLAPKEDPNHRLLGDLIAPHDLVVLVCPIDESAPKGRLILPQQMAIRDVLDSGAMALVCRETELAATLERLGTKPALVVTDSQAFSVVNKTTPDDIPLTSFSILMARYKGFLHTAAAGVAAVERLEDGDVVLMAEGCTHHRQCNDIGTVKIPRWLRAHTGRDLVIETCSGRDFPEDLSPYALVIHCGGCMITEREVQYRMRCAEDQGTPFTNYGIAIAQMTGALERSVRLFPDVHELLLNH
jgi:[FeFe] hydrogenase H-cluster maturation GTPase HydF